MHLLFMGTYHQDAVQKDNTKVAVVLDGGEWSASCPGRFASWKSSKYPTGGAQSSVDVMEKR